MEKATSRQLTKNYIHEYLVDIFSKTNKYRVLACFWMLSVSGRTRKQKEKQGFL